MNVRKKNAKEREYDRAELNKAKYDLAEEAVKFAQEFAECDGDVFYSTYKEFSNKAWEYEREKENKSKERYFSRFRILKRIVEKEIPHLQRILER